MDYTHQEQEQQQHQQKQHGFCVCGRCSGAFDSCSTFDVALTLPCSVVLVPVVPPLPPTPAAVLPAPTPTLSLLPFPLPLLAAAAAAAAAALCEDAFMPRKRQPLGISETVQDMLDRIYKLELISFNHSHTRHTYLPFAIYS